MSTYECPSTLVDQVPAASLSVSEVDKPGKLAPQRGLPTNNPARQGDPTSLLLRKLTHSWVNQIIVSLRFLLWLCFGLLVLDSVLKSCCGTANIGITASVVLCNPAQEARGHDTGHGDRQGLDEVSHQLKEGRAGAVEDTRGGEAVLEAARVSVLRHISLVHWRYETIMRTADKHLA